MDNRPYIPEELQYTVHHIWCRKDGTTWVVGITDFAQRELGEVLFVDLPEPESYFADDEAFGTVESLKSVSDLYMPISGKVVEYNVVLEKDPGIVNRDCYGAGWMIRIQPEKDSILMDAATYLALLTN